ncbi:MAG: hypothetical protein V4541_05220 [Bacteroidota bacterium]
MKTRLIVCAKLPVNGMALFPFIILKDKLFLYDKVILNHERIHLKQQLELLIIPFYMFYLFHYLINLIKYKSHDQAYLHIVFEKEAYANDTDLDYLKHRRSYAWLSYLLSGTK